MTNRIIAVASGGGHWEQLALLSPSLEGFAVTYVTTLKGLPEKSGLAPFVIVRDCNRDRPVDVFWSIVDIGRVVFRVKPAVVITTGAAPGLIALAWGKLFGATTIWIDSVANSERLSLSGKLAGKFVDLQLTQWQHVAEESGAKYVGSLL